MNVIKIIFDDGSYAEYDSDFNYWKISANSLNYQYLDRTVKEILNNMGLNTDPFKDVVINFTIINAKYKYKKVGPYYVNTDICKFKGIDLTSSMKLEGGPYVNTLEDVENCDKSLKEWIDYSDKAEYSINDLFFKMV